MFNLFSSRKGQVRGLDFSISLIIFMLTMSQLLILTNTFISGNRSQQSIDERGDFTTNLANRAIFTSGSSGWATTATSDLVASNWNFGMSSNGEIDPFKINRMSNWSLTPWLLDYDSIHSGLNISENVGISIVNPIDVDITSVVDNGANTIRLRGLVTQLNKPLTSAKIWGFAVNSTQDIAQSYGISDTLGNFDLNVTYVSALSASDYYTVAVIARFGITSEDAAISTYQRGTPAIPAVGRLNIFNQSSPVQTQGYTVNVTATMDPSVISSTVTAFYPGTNLGDRNFTKSSLPISPSTRFSVDNLSIPPTNTVIIIAIGLDVGGTFTTLSYINFPVSLDDEISKSIEPATTQQSTSSATFISIMIRGLVMQVEFITWEV